MTLLSRAVATEQPKVLRKARLKWADRFCTNQRVANSKLAIAGVKYLFLWCNAGKGSKLLSMVQDLSMDVHTLLVILTPLATF
jgi:hypothetical protein